MRPARTTRSGQQHRQGEVDVAGDVRLVRRFLQCRRYAEPAEHVHGATIRGRDQVTTDDQAQRHEIQQPRTSVLRFSPGIGGEDGGCARVSRHAQRASRIRPNSTPIARCRSGARVYQGRNSPGRSSTGPAAAVPATMPAIDPVQDDLDQSVAVRAVTPHRISFARLAGACRSIRLERDQCAQQHVNNSAMNAFQPIC